MEELIYVGDEVIIPNLFLEPLKDGFIPCPFIGFLWDGSSENLVQLVKNHCIDKGIREFKLSTIDVDVIRSVTHCHPQADKSHTLFVFDKHKKFITSCKKLSQLINHLIITI